MVLRRQNDRFQEKLLFSVSKINFLNRKKLLKAPLRDPSDEERTEGAQVQKKRPPLLSDKWRGDASFVLVFDHQSHWFNDSKQIERVARV